MAALGNNDKTFVAQFRRPRMFILLAKNKLASLKHRRDSTVELSERTGINDHPIKMTFQVVCRCSNIVHPQVRR